MIVALLFATTTFAQTIPLDHFDGGKNLTQGSKNGSSGTLSEIMRGLEVSLDGKLGTAAITSSITSGDATHAPSGGAVFTALALKLDAAKLAVYTSAAVVSGDATPTVVVTGLGASDTILAVTQSVAGANSLPLLGWSNQLANSLDLVYSADPGDGAIVKVLVKKP